MWMGSACWLRPWGIWLRVTRSRTGMPLNYCRSMSGRVSAWATLPWWAKHLWC